MSSFPTHVGNINKLKKMGFDVEEAFDGDEVDLESWGYDYLTNLLEEIISELESEGFKFKGVNNNE